MTASTNANPRPDEAGWGLDEEGYKERSEGYSLEAGTASRLERARRELQRLQAQPGFDPDDFAKWEAGRFAEAFAIPEAEAIQLCRETTPTAGGKFEKHEWLRRVAAFPVPLSAVELRLAMVIFGSVNGHLGFAWPSQRSLAAQAGGLNPRKVRAATAGLEQKGLIRRGKIADLTDAEREQLRRHGRGTYYTPVIPAEVEKPVRTEPDNLRRGKEAKRTAAVRSKGTTTVLSKRTAAVLPIREGKGRDQLDAGASSPHSQVSHFDRDVSSVETPTSASMREREDDEGTT